MKSIGIDIGTTTISFVITDNDTLTVLQKYTLAGNSFIQTGNSWERQARCTASSIQTPAMLSDRTKCFSRYLKNASTYLLRSYKMKKRPHTGPLCVHYLL